LPSCAGRSASTSQTVTIAIGGSAATPKAAASNATQSERSSTVCSLTRSGMSLKLNRPFKLTNGYIHLKLEPMLWTPSQRAIEATNVWRFMQRLGFSDREAFLSFSRNQPERFWDELVREVGIEWFHPYYQVLDASRGPEWT